MTALDLSMRKRSELEYVEPGTVRVEQYDPSDEIRTAHELVAHKLRIISQHFAVRAVTGEKLPTLSDALDAKVRLFGFSLDRKILWQWIKATRSNWSAKRP
jgi:hypothetical protein